MRIAAWFLTFWSCFTIIPGFIHTFLPDGGAGVIAGIDLTHCGSRIISLFAWAGATQIAWGILQIVVSIRNRSLVPIVLALVLLERIIMALNMWALKNPHQGHRPPETYITLGDASANCIFSCPVIVSQIQFLGGFVL